MTKQVADCHRFVRRDLQSVDVTAAGVGFGLAFSLDQLPNYSDFTNLFDSYSIDRVDIVILPSAVSVQIFGAPDYDDAVAPTGVADMLERQNVRCQVVSPGSYQQFRTSIVPRMPIEGSAAGPQMAPVGTRVDTADATVAYHGYKFWLAALGSTTSLTVILTYHMRFWAAK